MNYETLVTDTFIPSKNNRSDKEYLTIMRKKMIQNLAAKLVETNFYRIDEEYDMNLQGKRYRLSIKVVPDASL